MHVSSVGEPDKGLYLGGFRHPGIAVTFESQSRSSPVSQCESETGSGVFVPVVRRACAVVHDHTPTQGPSLPWLGDETPSRLPLYTGAQAPDSLSHLTGISNLFRTLVEEDSSAVLDSLMPTHVSQEGPCSLSSLRWRSACERVAASSSDGVVVLLPVVDAEDSTIVISAKFVWARWSWAPGLYFCFALHRTRCHSLGMVLR